jgi:von Willebrand factor type A domain-containing protein
MRIACLIAGAAAAFACAPWMPARAAEAPATLTKVNLAATDVGGGIEEITGFVGPGFTGRRLLDGRTTPVWRLDWYSDIAAERAKDNKSRTVDGPDEKPARLAEQPIFPVEIVLSFFGRQPALVGAVTVALPPAPAPLPKDVEVWISPESLTEGFEKVAERTLTAQPAEQVLSFPAREARYVKLRVLSATSASDFQLAEVRVLESARPGYVPLFTREPGVQRWKGNPREAAQRGLEWIQQAAVNWNDRSNCFGCHVQGQVLMGQAIALRNGYRVSEPALRILTESARNNTWDAVAGRAFAGMALARSNEVTGVGIDAPTTNALAELLKRQAKDGYFYDSATHLPIVQGQFDVTGNALVALEWAASNGGDARFKSAANRALTWTATHVPTTTQDKVFKVISLMRYGSPEQKKSVWSTVESLTREQQEDGGWKEVAALDGSNAFATGQVLYAYQQAGVSVLSPTFQRGVQYLLKTQVNDTSRDNGIWRAVKTQSQDLTELAPTMWAVIGLAAAYREDVPGALQVGEPQTARAATRNLEIVLDVSGSMNAKLGQSTRWLTALEVLKKFIATIPADFNVALRVYGHRYPSKSAETCTDTELLVPLAKLDRDRIINTASVLKPRGETPLVLSTLATIEDLQAAKGGTVILVTDGEESCKGDLKGAAATLKQSGLDVTLNIVGFTLTGQAVKGQLTTLAGSTGGRYFGASSGNELANAIRLAALPRMPFDLLDATGRVVLTGNTGEPGRELPNGDYRIRVKSPGGLLEDTLTIAPNRLTTVSFAFDGDKLVIRH